VLTFPVGNSQEILARTGPGIVLPAERTRDGDTRPDPNALASAMSELLDHPERLGEMGSHARAVWQREFTWSTVATRYEELYAQLVAVRQN
jgi:glycosyltransferase involved in cell wall biosynthesis